MSDQGFMFGGLIPAPIEVDVRDLDEDVARHEPPACPGCGHRVEQEWVNVEFNPSHPPEYIPGRWACHTPGCENGPPALPPGCTCCVADITKMSSARREYARAGDPQCSVHGTWRAE